MKDGRPASPNARVLPPGHAHLGSIATRPEPPSHRTPDAALCALATLGGCLHLSRPAPGFGDVVTLQLFFLIVLFVGLFAFPLHPSTRSLSLDRDPAGRLLLTLGDGSPFPIDGLGYRIHKRKRGRSDVIVWFRRHDSWDSRILPIVDTVRALELLRVLAESSPPRQRRTPPLRRVARLRQCAPPVLLTSVVWSASVGLSGHPFAPQRALALALLALAMPWIALGLRLLVEAVLQRTVTWTASAASVTPAALGSRTALGTAPAPGETERASRGDS